MPRQHLKGPKKAPCVSCPLSSGAQKGFPQSCPCTRCHSANTDHPSARTTLMVTRTLGGPVLVRIAAAVTDTAGGGKGLSALQAAGRGACLSYCTAAMKRHHAQGCLSEITCGSSGWESTIIMAGHTAAGCQAWC